MEVNSYLTDEERRILDSAKIGIAGAGGLGSNCAMHLIRAGVKRLEIVDFDTVALSNLNRQFFFYDQIGEKKVIALKRNLQRINPDAEIICHDLKLSAENLAGVFEDCDLVIEAFDGVEAKTQLIRHMLSLKRRVIAASGLAGWGRSNEVKVRRIGEFLYMIGDFSSGVDPALHIAPSSPRVGIAAAMEANTAMAILFGSAV